MTFGYGYGPKIEEQMQCFGDESDLLKCRRSSNPSCQNRYYDATVCCSGVCSGYNERTMGEIGSYRTVLNRTMLDSYNLGSDFRGCTGTNENRAGSVRVQDAIAGATTTFEVRAKPNQTQAVNLKVSCQSQESLPMRLNPGPLQGRLEMQFGDSWGVFV